jgi:hypothetical protein
MDGIMTTTQAAITDTLTANHMVTTGFINFITMKNTVITKVLSTRAMSTLIKIQTGRITQQPITRRPITHLTLPPEGLAELLVLVERQLRLSGEPLGKGAVPVAVVV